MNRNRQRFRVLPVVVLVAVLFASGCTAPTAVKRYAEVSKTASEQFAGIQQDINRSCIRQQYYQGLSVSHPVLDSLRAASGSTCKDYEKAAKSLRKANGVLIDYLKTLSKLADKKMVVYDDDFDDLADALGDTYPFDERRVAAVASVSSFLVEVAAGAWRRGEMGKAIERTNDDIQVLTAMLDEVISEDYLRLLDRESEAARKYYLGKVKTGGEEEPLAAVLVYDLWQKKELTLEAKRDAARAYGKILCKIAKGHQQLFNNRSDLDSKEMKRFILQYTETIEDLIRDVKYAF